MRALVWFRSDLRVDDNPALAAAASAADEGVVGLFIITPEQWDAHDWGAPKRSFVLRSVRHLAGALDGLGIALDVERCPRFSDCPELLLASMADLGCDALFANREYEVNERRRDERVEERLRAAGRELRWFHDQTVVRPGRLETKAGDPYSVYSPFRRRWIEALEQEGVPSPHQAPASRRNGVVDSTGLSLLDDAEPDVGREILERWPAGEKEAAERLERFVTERAGDYDTARDLPAADGTSRLGPYLAAGVVSIRRCLEAVLTANDGRLSGGSQGLATWIDELVWREFYRHVLVAFPRVSKHRAFRPETEAVEWRDDETGFQAWCDGRTGVPFVDAGMRQLVTTGWMHNRLRMVTAMFLTKDLLVDWRRGERFFARHLVDLDLANNNGGWQWSASTGTDAAPYFRIMNPWTQAARYDPAGDFIRRWVPELAGVEARDLHDPKRLAKRLEAAGIDYPEPIVEHKAARIRAVEAFEAAKRS